MALTLDSQCPDIKIQLHIVGKRCDEQPVSSFSTETFPNVVYLRLVVRGPRISQENMFNRVEDILRPRLASDTSTAYEVIPQRRAELTSEFAPLKVCAPSTEFWTSFLDGRTFPELEQFMLDHCPLEFEWKQHYPDPHIVPQDIPQVRKLRFFLVTGAQEFDNSILIAAAPLFRNLTTLCLSKLYQVTYTGSLYRPFLSAALNCFQVSPSSSATPSPTSSTSHSPSSATTTPPTTPTAFSGIPPTPPRNHISARSSATSAQRSKQSTYPFPSPANASSSAKPTAR